MALFHTHTPKLFDFEPRNIEGPDLTASKEELERNIAIYRAIKKLAEKRYAEHATANCLMIIRQLKQHITSIEQKLNS